MIIYTDERGNKWGEEKAEKVTRNFGEP